MAEVPDNQKVEKVLPTVLNQGFAETAEALLPELRRSKHTPVRSVRFKNDTSEFFKVKSVLDNNNIDWLPTALWGKGT